MNENPFVESKAAELRQAFDLSFALPPPQASEEVEDLLAIRVAGDPYAIRLRDIAGMVAGRKVVPVSAVTLDLLGLAGIRGGVVPVFGLASILGYGQAPGSPRWMILCGAEEPIALAFSDFEGYLRLPKSSLQADENLRAKRQYVDQVASTEAGVRAVISIPLVVATIRNRIGNHRLAKEQ
ncbi:MAG TPA: chemotaxis protein CheW [Gemmatimonadaceae bacterium]